MSSREFCWLCDPGLTEHILKIAKIICKKCRLGLRLKIPSSLNFPYVWKENAGNIQSSSDPEDIQILLWNVADDLFLEKVTF